MRENRDGEQNITIFQSMIELKSIEKKGTEAVRKLRQQKLRSGHPFMINSRDLNTDQCYLEFPDGTIKLATFKKAARDFDIIRILSPDETQSIRFRYNFYI
jgi:hypothetical protein